MQRVVRGLQLHIGMKQLLVLRFVVPSSNTSANRPINLRLSQPQELTNKSLIELLLLNS